MRSHRVVAGASSEAGDISHYLVSSYGTAYARGGGSGGKRIHKKKKRGFRNPSW